MNTNIYPEGIDCVWLASDRDGHVAAFVTGGTGPIPVRALDSPPVQLEDVEVMVNELPISSIARLLVPIKRPDDFISFAERGIYVYDWRDVHRTLLEASHAYEPVASPVDAVQASSLPKDLAALVHTLKFDLRFPDGQPIKVSKLTTCVQSGAGS